MTEKVSPRYRKKAPTRGGRRPGAGRKKGVPNKLSGDVKAMILAALDEAGGAEYLVKQAKKNPTAFMTLLGKVLPMTVSGPAFDAMTVLLQQVAGNALKPVAKPESDD